MGWAMENLNDEVAAALDRELPRERERQMNTVRAKLGTLLDTFAEVDGRNDAMALDVARELVKRLRAMGL